MKSKEPNELTKGEGVSLATVIMIWSLLKDSSDGFVAIPIQMMEEITNKVHRNK